MTGGWRPESRPAFPTARNGPPERIPICDWDAGVSEHAKEKDRMFVRGLLTLLEADGLAIVRTPNCSLGIFYTSWDYGLWHMALTTGVNVAARPGRVGALGSFAVDAGRFGDAGAGRADRCGRRRIGRPRVWMADRARECGLVLQADAFPASPENATQVPQDRMALRRSQPAWSAAPIPHGRLPPACATDPAVRRKEPRSRVRRRHRRRPAPSRPAVRTRRVDRISRCRPSGSPGRAGPAPGNTSAITAERERDPGQQARSSSLKLLFGE
jgi:hypothetical protein